MMCDAARPLLQPYLDTELDRAQVAELEHHLASCRDCRAELVPLEELRAGVRSAPRYPAPRDLRERLQALDDLPVATERAVRLVPRPTWALAAAVLMGALLGAGAMWLQMSNGSSLLQQRGLAQDLLTGHLRALAAASPVDVVSEDRHTVKPWFNGRVDASPPVVDLSDQGFPLVGGRIDYVTGRRIPVLVYRHRQHVIDVFLTAEPQQENERTRLQLQGYWLATCQLGGRSAWIVTDTEERELLRFRDLLMRSTSPADRAP